MRMLSILLVLCCSATICAAEWEIVSVSAEPFGGDAFGNAKEVMLKVRVRNTSARPIFVPTRRVTDGEIVPTAAYFVQSDGESVWKKLTSGGSDTAGASAKRQGVAPTEIMCCMTLLSAEHAGRRMLVAVRCGDSKHDIKGDEILVGPFTVPVE